MSISESSSGEIIVIGSANQDFISYSSKLPKAGETIISPYNFSTSMGGKGNNQCIAASKLLKDLLDVKMVCRVGNDSIGTEIIDNLRDNGVNVEHVLVDDTISSGVAMISVEEGTGENRIVVHPGANAKLSLQDIQSAFRKKKGVVLVQLEIPMETAMEGLKLGKENGYVTILNPAPASLLPPEIWKYVDIVVPNETELSALVDDTDDLTHQLMNKLKPINDKISIINTIGSGGAIVHHYNAEPVTVSTDKVNVVDTVGAGDAFCGALASYLILCNDRDALVQATKFACAVASISVTSKGAQSSYPTLHQLPHDILTIIRPYLPKTHKTLTFITANLNKLKEVQQLLSSDFPYRIQHTELDIPELQGSSAIVIAKEKCKYAFNRIKAPVFIEDTSLSFCALGDLPGPYIKWFLQKLGLEGLNTLLAGYEDKSAKAVTIIAYKYSKDADVQVFIGETEGRIVLPRGTTSFGWDAIFETKTKDGLVKTYGEMGMVEKNLISHRGKAFAKMRDFFINS